MRLHDLIQQTFENIPEHTYKYKQFFIKQDTPPGEKMLERTRHSNNLYNTEQEQLRKTLKNIKQGLHWRGGSSQLFVRRPFQILRDDLRDKCWLAGILVIETEESSLLDGDPLPVYDVATYKKGQFKSLFSDSCRYRGLYVSGSGVRVNADVNGAGNILWKVFPHALDGVGSFGYLLNPVHERVGCFRYDRASHVRFCRGVGHA